jgi:hypothetical protein
MLGNSNVCYVCMVSSTLIKMVTLVVLGKNMLFYFILEICQGTEHISLVGRVE